MVTNSFNNYRVSLLVTERIKYLSKLTSDPKRASDNLHLYMGIQTRHQHMIGNLWFMNIMLLRNIYSHEVQTLARKIVYGFKWREIEIFNTKIQHQSRSIIQTRKKVQNEDFKKLLKEHKRSVRMLNKMTSQLKLRITLRTFKTKIHELEIFT